MDDVDYPFIREQGTLIICQSCGGFDLRLCNQEEKKEEPSIFLETRKYKTTIHVHQFMYFNRRPIHTKYLFKHATYLEVPYCYRFHVLTWFSMIKLGKNSIHSYKFDLSVFYSKQKYGFTTKRVIFMKHRGLARII